MKYLLVLAGIALILGICAAWFYGALRSVSTGEPPNLGQGNSLALPAPGVAVASSSVPGSLIEELKTGTDFHVFVPTILPPGFGVSVNANLEHFDGGLIYSIDASGTPIVTVEEKPLGDQDLQFFSTSQLEAGSVSSTQIDGATGYVGLVTKGLKPGHQVAVVLFTKNAVDIQLSSFNTQPQALLELANAMQ